MWVFPVIVDLPPPGDCADLRNRGVSENGVHSVHVQHLGQTLDVYCDMETAGGGWLVCTFKVVIWLKYIVE